MPFRPFLEKQEKHFEKGGKLEKLAPMYEMVSTFFYQTSARTSGKTHIRDAVDLKRIMITIAIGLIPCLIMAFYNTGYQSNLLIERAAAMNVLPEMTWQIKFMTVLGLDFDPANIFSNFFHGFLYAFPIYLVTITVGGTWELIFAILRKHEINESFLVTSMLFPLVLPPTVPLWQAALAISFGVVIGKELFGGTGRNIVNPALFSRAFLFFAYPSSVTGISIWYGAQFDPSIDGLTGATPLTLAKTEGLINVDWLDAFLGLIPGSMGETSTLACLIGACLLIWTRIGSFRIMLSCVLGLVTVVLLFNIFGSDTNAFYQINPGWHLLLGGFMFGAIFMATDPVSAAMTPYGKVIYGFMIGAITGLVRFANPAYPEGMMLAILFCNVCAPTIDYFFIKRNIRHREVRCAK